MSRKPIQQELTGGKSQRQRIWDLIRKKPSGFSIPDVTPGGTSSDTSRDYLYGLTIAGYLEVKVQGKPPRTQTEWKLVKDIGAEAPRVNKHGKEVTQGRGNEAIWGAMQALGTFTYRVLASMSGVPESTVKTYCMMLDRAGYLAIDVKGQGKGCGGIPTTYRLLKSRVTGPRPPMITKLKAVYDPNVHQIVWQQDEDDAVEMAEAV